LLGLVLLGLLGGFAGARMQAGLRLLGRVGPGAATLRGLLVLAEDTFADALRDL
jgi:hypothetical protein